MKFRIKKIHTPGKDWEFKLNLEKWNLFLLGWLWEDTEYFYSGGNQTQEELIKNLIDKAKAIESKDNNQTISRFVVKNSELV